MAVQPTCVFMSGPIGVGKSTLGREVARAIGGHFIEGDDHSRSDRPWYATSLSTSRSILAAIVSNATEDRPVIVAYPLSCKNRTFYRRKLADADIRLMVVSLSAGFDAITRADRGRCFSEAERQRIRTMIEEGYGRPFSDLFVQTDSGAPEATAHKIAERLSCRL